jgi:hypothetical protein
MLILMAFGVLILPAVATERTQHEGRLNLNIRHSREDLCLMAYLLVAIIIMLGVRMH